MSWTYQEPFDQRSGWRKVGASGFCLCMLEDLSVPRANHLEALRKDRAGQHSIRINAQYRVCFVWTDEGPTEVEIADYHD